MEDLRRALHEAADAIADYREGLREARVTPLAGRDDVVAALGQALPDAPSALPAVIDELIAAARPGLMASSGPRYYGFVIGGSVDAALVADMFTSGWDQCGFNPALSPAAIGFEDVAGAWLKELLHIPASASVGFVTGAQAANTAGLAAARLHVLARHGWDVGRDGLFGAPRVRVLAGAERHATVDRALRLLGLGGAAVDEVPALRSGAMDAAALRDALAVGSGRADHRLRAGRQREHGRVRRPARDRSGRAHPRRMAARRRRLRPVGRGQPAHRPSGRGPRARRLLGLRRAQVAERPLRLRATCSAPTRRCMPRR